MSGASAGAAPTSLTGLAPVLEAGGPALASALASTERRLEEVTGAHGAELARHASATLAAGGKRLRPMLVYLCAGSEPSLAGNGEGTSTPLLHAAAAVELLHMATLVHDDVLDRATLRRGRSTIFSSAGRTGATATGDMLFSRAFAELVRAGDRDAVRALSSAASALVRGELMQREDAWSESVTPARYLERCELKTARLFEAACRLGALLGEPGREAAAALGAFGAAVGVAFQMLDDVLDVAGPPERTGKARGADLLDGTVTLPLILARRRDPELAALDLRAVGTRPVAVEALCDRIAASGALVQAREQALSHVARAKAALEGLGLTNERRRLLDLVADGVVERYA